MKGELGDGSLTTGQVQGSYRAVIRFGIVHDDTVRHLQELGKQTQALTLLVRAFPFGIS